MKAKVARKDFNMKRKFLIIFIALIITILFLLIKNQLSSKTASNIPQSSSQTKQTINDKPKIISTKPEPLEEAIISASEVVEITFNRPLENVGEFKVRIDPKIDFKIELSGDRKTAKIIPSQPYGLGQSYTIFIGTETKFDGVGRWGEEKIIHFRTIRYRGI